MPPPPTDSFSDPLIIDNRHRPVLMWFWNARQTEAEVRRQIGEFQSQGLLEFFIHAAYGLETPYLDDEFMRLVGVAIDEARRRGMRFWIYDENSWPSGCAGGLVLRDHPDARMRQLAFARFDVPAGERVEIARPGEPLAAFVIGDAACDEPRVERLDRDLAAWHNGSAGPAILLVFRVIISGGVHPACKWAAEMWEQPGTLDTGDAEAVRRYIESTHERYYQHFAADFGKTLAGSFTDEPPLCTGWILELPKPFMGMPWTRRMLETFRERRGYELTDELYLLAIDAPRAWRVRYDYWLHVTECYGESYAKQIADWCAAHDIELTGHINCEETLFTTMYGAGDLYRVLKWFQQPGIDSVESALWMHLEETVVPPKLIGAIARQSGNKRSFCETYTGSGWDANFEIMKRVANRLSLLGVEIIQFMGAYYSVKGFRKLPPDAAWPPSHADQNALWPHYHLFVDYLARLSRLNAAGTHAARVGVFYPITNAWCMHRFGHFQLSESDPEYTREWAIIMDTFTGLARGLLETQIDYEFVFDEPFAAAKVIDGTLALGDQRIETMVLPACTMLPRAVLDKLIEFAATGGRILFINGVPSWTEEGKNLRGDLLARWGLDAAAIAERVTALWQSDTPQCEVIQGSHPAVSVLVSNCFSAERRTTLRPSLSAALGLLRNVSISPPSPHVWVQTRLLDDGPQVCFINDSDQPYRGAVTLHRHYSAQVLRVHPGDETVLTVATTATSNAQTFPLELRAYDLVFMQACSGAAITQPGKNAGTAKRLELPDQWTLHPLAQNTFRVPLEIQAEPDTAQATGPFTSAADPRFPAGMPQITGNGNGYGQMCREYPLTALKPGSRYWVRGEFLLNAISRQLELVLEDLQLDEVRVNGVTLTLTPRRVWDSANMGVDIRPHARLGKNIVQFRITIPNWNAPHALPLVAICGDFAVQPDGSLSVATTNAHPAGDWRAQGFPHYSGTIAYEQSIEIPPGWQGRADARLVVDAAAEVVTALLDGYPLGTRLWRPFQFELPRLTAGPHSLRLEITSTSANLYGQGKASGLLGQVRIEA